MSTVLVTDGEERAALAVTRSLGRAGHRVHVCARRTRSLAGASRYSRGQAQVPDPLTEPKRYLEALLGLIRRWGVDVLVPITEASLLAVLGARERFSRVEIPFADYETFRSVSDKRLVLERAARVGIAVPRQWVLGSAGEVDELLAAGLEYPLVVKPSRSVGGGAGERVRLGVSHAAGPAELRERLTTLPAAAFPVLLQRRVEGPGVGVFLLLREGEVVAQFAHRRLREKPPWGGVSVYSESVALDPELLSRSVALLREFGWSGPAMVEYKVDAATGVPYLMEINGRFWGSLQLAIDAGVDFPALLLDPIPPAGTPPGYRTGVRLRWWLGDLDHHLIRLRGARSMPTPPEPRWRLLLEFLRTGFRRDVRNEVFRPTDPLPALREAFDWLRRS